MKSINIAACALIFNNVGHVLSVSRKNNVNDKGFPGGKANPGEDPALAVLREVLEETGKTVEVIEKFYEGMDGEFYTITYLCRIIDIPENEGPFKTTETGIVEFIPWSELLHKESTFYEYNKKLYDTKFPTFN